MAFELGEGAQEPLGSRAAALDAVADHAQVVVDIAGVDVHALESGFRHWQEALQDELLSRYRLVVHPGQGRV